MAEKELDLISLFYREGLKSFAERSGQSVTEVAVRSLIEEKGTIYNLPFLINALKSLDPGIIYTGGLLNKAGVTPDLLKKTAKKIVKDLETIKAEEHIPYVKQALTWHTGKEL